MPYVSISSKREYFLSAEDRPVCLASALLFALDQNNPVDESCIVIALKFPLSTIGYKSEQLRQSFVDGYDQVKWKGQRSALLAISPLKKQNGINMSNSTAYFNQWSLHSHLHLL